MSVKPLTEHHLEFVSLKGGCTGSFESTLVKMPHSWKSHAGAHFLLQEVKSLEEARTLLISQKVDIQNKIDEMEEKVRKVHNFSGKMIHFTCLDNHYRLFSGAIDFIQGLHRLEKYLSIQDCLEKSLKIKFALKST